MSVEEAVAVADVQEANTTSLVKKVQALLEFYFSDANLNHDKFMQAQLKQQQSNMDQVPSVAISTLLTFNKLKSLVASDVGIVQQAVEQSDALALSENKEAIHRITPYQPEEATAVAKKTLILGGMKGFQEPTIEQVQNLIETQLGGLQESCVVKYIRKRHDMKRQFIGSILVEFEAKEQLDKIVEAKLVFRMNHLAIKALPLEVFLKLSGDDKKKFNKKIKQLTALISITSTPDAQGITRDIISDSCSSCWADHEAPYVYYVTGQENAMLCFDSTEEALAVYQNLKESATVSKLGLDFHVCSEEEIKVYVEELNERKSKKQLNQDRKRKHDGGDASTTTSATATTKSPFTADRTSAEEEEDNDKKSNQNVEADAAAFTYPEGLILKLDGIPENVSREDIKDVFSKLLTRSTTSISATSSSTEMDSSPVAAAAAAVVASVATNSGPTDVKEEVKVEGGEVKGEEKNADSCPSGVKEEEKQEGDLKVQFVEFQRGSTSGFCRVNVPAAAKKVMEQFKTEEGIVLMPEKPKLKDLIVLEGLEEKEYWLRMQADRSNRCKPSSKRGRHQYQQQRRR